MRRTILLFFVVFLVACGDESAESNSETFGTTESKDVQIQKGNVLFNVNCKLCHSMDITTPTSLAPVLDSVRSQWPDSDVLMKYIKNAPAMMQATEHSRKVYSEWKDKAQMPPFNGLTQDDIGYIITFLYENTE